MVKRDAKETARQRQPAKGPRRSASAAPLTEQDLDKVVGGYIGETEKNLGPNRG